MEAAALEVLQDLLFGLEIVEERPPRDARGRGDRFQRGGLVTVLDEQPQSGLGDPLKRLLPFPLAQSSDRVPNARHGRVVTCQPALEKLHRV